MMEQGKRAALFLAAPDFDGCALGGSLLYFYVYKKQRKYKQRMAEYG